MTQGENSTIGPTMELSIVLNACVTYEIFKILKVLISNIKNGIDALENNYYNRNWSTATFKKKLNAMNICIPFTLTLRLILFCK